MVSMRCEEDVRENQGMTYDGDVVDNSEEGSAETCNVECTSADTPLADNPQWDSSFVALVDLQGDEHRDQDAESDEETDDLCVVPRVLAASPLESQKNTDDSWNEDGCPFNIHECELVFPA